MGKKESEPTNRNIMQLSRKILGTISGAYAEVPPDSLFDLPERVLQFGTGVLLRGLPDHLVDKANKAGVFNGRIVVVKSTANGATDAFAQQDGLYTLVERGVDNGEATEKIFINAAISRVLSATAEWEKIQDCMDSPHMQVVLSNTTEVGIALVESDATATQPVSFPGRLLHLLIRRYEKFGGSADAGLVIVPTELIPENGTKLKTIVLKLAKLKGLPQSLVNWIETANDFCNSLVDCIVPGKLPAAEQETIEKKLGYRDELMIMSEPYRLWAIETSSRRTKDILSFGEAAGGVVLSPDINKFRELKLRLLNGTHTLSCGLAHLSGFTTVKEAMKDEVFAGFVTGLMTEEIASLVVSGEITQKEALTFAAQVADRFRNPYIEHRWLSICVQYTSKMGMRTVPLLEKYYVLYGHVPVLMAAGFAAFMVFMHVQPDGNGGYIGNSGGKRYKAEDDKASLLAGKWQNSDVDTLVNDILKDPAVFGKDLTEYPGLAGAVSGYVSIILKKGARELLRSLADKKSLA